MAKRTNPLDTEAAKPVDFSQANAAREAAKADSDRITAEMNEKVNRAIAAIEDLSNVANGVVDLIGKIVPLVTRVTPAEGPDYVASVRSQLAELRALACTLTGRCT